MLDQPEGDVIDHVQMREQGEVLEHQRKMPPLGRFVRPEEVAGTIAFLLGPDAGAITGQQIVICGGSSL